MFVLLKLPQRLLFKRFLHVKKIFAFIFTAFLFNFNAYATPVSGDQRGVTFFYLDGGGHDFPWVLEHQYDSQVREKIDALLSQYRKSGINWIRLLVAADHFYDAKKELVYPVPEDSLINNLNDFMAITRSGDNAGQFTIELVLVPKTNKFMFNIIDFSIDEAWYRKWFDNLDFHNLGIIMIGGDLAPCSKTGHCEGDPNVHPYFDNHGKWIKHMWSWKEIEYPNINASFEVAFEDGLPNNTLVHNTVKWIDENTPTVPTIAAAMYINLTPGTSWEDYAYMTQEFLDVYHSSTSKPLWIDEIGHSIGQGWKESDQIAYFQGVLAASVCWSLNKYPTFIWVAGNDTPYDKKQVFGLVEGFNGNTPIMRTSWSVIEQYFNLQQCP